jgi:hypothetical protein
MRKSPRPGCAVTCCPPSRSWRHRTTQRRRDAAPLPRRKIAARTVGKTYTAPDGKTFRPSLFITLTCPSYGRVREDGTPIDTAAYDYTAAARDALHFSALFDRFMQNLRRFLGYDVQYFAAIEPQRRLASADAVTDKVCQPRSLFTLVDLMNRQACAPTRRQAR